jgi:hypothetical protein
MQNAHVLGFSAEAFRCHVLTILNILSTCPREIMLLFSFHSMSWEKARFTSQLLQWMSLPERKISCFQGVTLLWLCKKLAYIIIKYGLFARGWALSVVIETACWFRLSIFEDVDWEDWSMEWGFTVVWTNKKFR